MRGLSVSAFHVPFFFFFLSSSSLGADMRAVQLFAVFLSLMSAAMGACTAGTIGSPGSAERASADYLGYDCGSPGVTCGEFSSVCQVTNIASPASLNFDPAVTFSSSVSGNVISFPELQSITATGAENGIVIFALPELSSASFPKLLSISVNTGHALRVEGTSQMVTLDLQSLTSVETQTGSVGCMSFDFNLALETLRLDALESVICRGGTSGILFRRLLRMVNLNVPGLLTLDAVGDGLHIVGNVILDSAAFPLLQSVTATENGVKLEGANDVLTSVSFPQLTSITTQNGNCIDVISSTGLQSLSFPALTTVVSISGTGMRFQLNPSLETVSVPELQTI